MRQWLFEKSELSNSPSRKAGIDAETEDRYRREGVRFILDIGGNLKLTPSPTLATAAVYFQRFYVYHSFREFPRHVTACACMFLAGKVEETPKKCRDIVAEAQEKLSAHHMATFGRDPREEVMSVERVLLQTIKFDLQVLHPYHYLLQYAKIFKSDKQAVQQMVQMAWTFVNDSLCTSLCLQWEPEVIAIALIYLASRLSKTDISDWEGKKDKKDKWWDLFVSGMTMKLMEDICHQVLDLYSNRTKGSSESHGGGSSSKGSSSGASSATPNTPTQHQQPPPPPPPTTATLTNTAVAQSTVTSNAAMTAYASTGHHQHSTIVHNTVATVVKVNVPTPAGVQPAVPGVAPSAAVVVNYAQPAAVTPSIYGQPTYPIPTPPTTPAAAPSILPPAYPQYPPGVGQPAVAVAPPAAYNPMGYPASGYPPAYHHHQPPPPPPPAT